MRIKSFKIENFRNITLAECTTVPDFVVICGGNGSGKSALLEALMTAKEAIGSYGGFTKDTRAVSADAPYADISMTLAFSAEEQAFCLSEFGNACPAETDIHVRIARSGTVSVLKTAEGTSGRLLSHFGRAANKSGFFDYITAHRRMDKRQLQTIDASGLDTERVKNTLGNNINKFEQTKQYLASLQLQDLQELQKARRAGETYDGDSLRKIREFFDRFFSPMKFVEVRIDESPMSAIVSTPRGEIDIDDLSSGEKEILTMYVRFHQLEPVGAVILFDEADAHLHPDLERRYLTELRTTARGSQFILTTHSPEMMIEAGAESLFTVLKAPSGSNQNQFVAVSGTAEMHEALSSLMGSRGLISFNQRIVFIEGEDSSSDRAIYEALYPPAKYQVSFVPAGDSSTVRKTAERVNTMLTASTGFQQYFSIIDRDIPRAEDPKTGGDRLFRLPVYHVENFLIADDGPVLETAKLMMGDKCPFKTLAEVEASLKDQVLGSSHLRGYTKALLDAEISGAAKKAYDDVYKHRKIEPISVRPFAELEQDATARLTESLNNGSWRQVVKGRDLLKSFCGSLNLSYEHFSNVLLNQIKTPPPGLAEIMAKILS